LGIASAAWLPAVCSPSYILAAARLLEYKYEDKKFKKRRLAMNKTKAIISSIFSGTLLVLLTLSPALGAERVTLQAGSDMPGAQGEVVISDAGAGSKEVVITAQGLKPNEVYTVWLITEKLLGRMDMAGLGTGDYAFTSDARGNGHYTATISAKDLDRWQQIKIAHHPDRNPKNMDNIGSALEGKLK
jgi:hypothetical protein